MIKVAVSGAAGRMGREVMRTVWRSEDIELVGAVDPYAEGIDVGSLIEAGDLGIKVRPGLDGMLEEVRPDVLIDFTNPDSVFNNACTALRRGVRPVVGTTGMSQEHLGDLRELASRCRTGCVVAPNFAIGALLMMKFAAEASRYFPHVEIIELHHDRKVDAPSGTALKTAQLITRDRGDFRSSQVDEVEKLACARGARYDNGIRIHSVRLPGLVAHQEVIFGGLGQTLIIRHDSISRESFMPGVLLAVRKVMELTELVYGLENIIFDSGGSADSGA
ncbi:MAG: dihydrodipicolinate reductase [Peptococcaceae bacterium BRH_c4a]|nr:MAG: dihydrodipicolinate reductase [Peptococcaceae bacterium BRH_c4a]